MGLKKNILYLLIILFLTSNVFAVNIEKNFDETNDIKIDWEIWRTTDHPDALNLDDTRPIYASGLSNAVGDGTISEPSILGQSARLFLFPREHEDYVLKREYIDLGDVLAGNIFFELTPYGNGLNQEITFGQSCKVSFPLFDFETNELTMFPSLQRLKTSDGDEITNTENVIEHLMKKYYYMKTQITANLMKNNSGDIIIVETIYPDEKIPDVDEVPGYDEYVLITPNLNTFNFDLPDNTDILNAYSEGIYYWNFTIEPIDLKCDFNQANGLEAGEIEIVSKTYPSFIIGHPILEDAKVSEKTTALIQKEEIIEYTNPDYHILDDNYTKRKIIYNNDTEDFKYIDKNDIEQAIIIPKTRHKEIIVYKNNINIRNDTILPQEIALNHHQIRKLDNPTNAQKFINDTYNTMLDVNITVFIDNQTTIGKTNIKIKLEIPEGLQENITLYQVVPKSIASTINDIDFIDNGNSQLLILDKDPVIGWYFNESDGSEEVEYEVNGTNETGTIIITQEPILFNEGNLIVNYRETNCNNDEAFLFEIDDLIESKIYTPGSNMTYKVCIGHTSKTLDATINHLTHHIFDYTNASNLSFNTPMPYSVDISILNTTPMFWDLRVQEDNPNGNYSCIGSIDNKDNSLFGDCIYSTNRLWIHLGEDLAGPITTLSHSKIGHSLEVVLNAEDVIGGSGIDKTYYCIKNITEDCLNLNTFVEYNSPFIVTCDTTWGCYKEIFFYSTDLIGNQETIKSETLKLVDKGSSCQPDCTAIPSPDRYLKECINMNSCKYYAYNNYNVFDGGDYVAKQCDHLIRDSWTTFNDTHEIKCPLGPFREKIFSFEKLFYKSDTCENLQLIKNLVYINGDFATMNIVYCID